MSHQEFEETDVKKERFFCVHDIFQLLTRLNSHQNKIKTEQDEVQHVHVLTLLSLQQP